MKSKAGNVWEIYEKQTLIDNANVTAIETIDPQSEIANTIFKR